MGMFDDAATAGMPGGSGARFKDGIYRVRINLAKQGMSQQGKGGYCVVECSVLETLVGYEGSNVPGELLSWVQLQKWQPFQANINGFVVAVSGIDPSKITPKHCEKAFSGDGTGLAGVEVVAIAVTIETKSKNPFTKVTWKPVSEIAEILAEASAA